MGAEPPFFEPADGGQSYGLATVFMLAWPYGTPRVTSGYDWDRRWQVDPGTGQRRDDHDWIGPPGDDRGRTLPVTRWWEGSGQRVAFGRGDRGFVVINGEPDPWGAVLRTDLPPGRYDNWLATDPGSIVVDEGGVLRVTVPPGQAVVLAIPTIRPRGVEN